MSKVGLHFFVFANTHSMYTHMHRIGDVMIDSHLGSNLAVRVMIDLHLAEAGVVLSHNYLAEAGAFVCTWLIRVIGTWLRRVFAWHHSKSLRNGSDSPQMHCFG